MEVAVEVAGVGRRPRQPWIRGGGSGQGRWAEETLNARRQWRRLKQAGSQSGEMTKSGRSEAFEEE